jgi:hypothetical protein
MRPVVGADQRHRARLGRRPHQLGQAHRGRDHAVHHQQRDDVGPGQVAPDGRGPVQHGPGMDRAAVTEQVTQQVAGQPALHIEEVPLLEQQQGDDQGEPLDDTQLHGLGGRPAPGPPGKPISSHAWAATRFSTSSSGSASLTARAISLTADIHGRSDGGTCDTVTPSNLSIYLSEGKKLIWPIRHYRPVWRKGRVGHRGPTGH